MENNTVESEFQIGKNSVKEFKIDVIDRNFPRKREYTFELQVGISDIRKDKEYQYAIIYLKYNIDLKNKEENDDKEYLNVYLNQTGEFRAPLTVTEQKFIEYCKYNGAPMLSQNARAYLKAVTALSDIEVINLPMINFKEFFEDKYKEN